MIRPPEEGKRALLCERGARTWWELHADGTRSLVGSEEDATALIRSWSAYEDPEPVDLVPGVVQWWPPSVYVGQSFTAHVVSSAEVERWPVRRDR